MAEADANHGLPPSAFILDQHVQAALDMSYNREFHFDAGHAEESAMDTAMLGNLGGAGNLPGGYETTTMPFLSGQSTPFVYPSSPLDFHSMAHIPQRSASDGMPFTSNVAQALCQPYDAQRAQTHSVQTGEALCGGPLGTNNMTYDVVEPQERLQDMMADTDLGGQQSPSRKGRQSNGSTVVSESPRTSKRKTSASSAQGKKTDGKISTFLTKLYAILESPEYQHMIHWDHDGTQIIIEQPGELESKVLPLVYKQSRFASFSRQLNIYGWMRKVSLRNTGRDGSNEHDASQWSHAFLNRRANPLDLISFKRRVPPRLHTRRVSQTSESGQAERRDSGDDADGPWTGFEMTRKEDDDTAQPLPVAYVPMTATLPIPRRTSSIQTTRWASNGWEGGPAPSPHKSQPAGFQTRPYPKLNEFSSREVAWSQAFRLRNPFEGVPVSAPASHSVFHPSTSYGTSSDSMSSDGIGLSSVPNAADPPFAFRHQVDRQESRDLPAITRLTQEVDALDRADTTHIKRHLGSMSAPGDYTHSSFLNSLPQFGLSQSTFFTNSDTAAFPFTPPSHNASFNRPMQPISQRDEHDAAFGIRTPSYSYGTGQPFGLKSPDRVLQPPAFKASLATIQNSDIDAYMYATASAKAELGGKTEGFRQGDFIFDPDDVLSNTTWRTTGDRMNAQ